MGKQRKNKKRNKIRKFQNLSSKRAVDTFLVSEEHRAEQSAHQKRILDLERDILSKTIFVTSVKDLNNEINLRSLKRFFEEQYGPVKTYERARFLDKRKRPGRPYPPARIRFENAADAETIFEGQMLIRVRSAKKINCPVGYKGSIKVQPSRKYDGILDSEHVQASVVELHASELATGHWFGVDDEMWLPEDDQFVADEWFEEHRKDGDFTIVINTRERKIDIRTKSDSLSRFSSPHEHSTDILSFWLKQLQQPIEITDILSFGLKQLQQPIEICRNPESDNSCWLIFPLKHPPKLEKELVDGDYERRIRCIQFGDLQANQFGDCTALKLTVTEQQLHHLFMNTNSFEKLKTFGIVHRGLYSLQNMGCVIFDRIGRRNEEFHQAIANLSEFRLTLLIRSLIDSGKCCWYHTLNDSIHPKSLYQLVKDCIDSGMRDSAESALQRMFHASGRTRYPCKLFSELLQSLPSSVAKSPDYSVPIFGLHLTVCREAVQGYSEEVSNRLVRKLLRNPGFTPESFLRVEVAEEDGRTLFGADLIGDVENHFRSRIMAGIQLHGRVYQFLAYSSSQLKTNSFWMIHASRDWPVTRIRSDLGDFSRCKSASLYAARVGQCLSTTFEGSVNTNRSRRTYTVGEVEDVSNTGAMIHSDGTGLISRDAMAKLVESLPFGPSNSADASIVQVRIGGAKGTLTSWDFQMLSHISASCSKRDVLLRPSMIKFDADYSSLEVCKVGSRTTYHLNRHVILLLATQGVPQDNFIKMQREIIEDICEMVRNREKAIDLLSFLPGPDSKQRGVLLNMLKYGLNPSTEPFVFSSLISMLLHNLFQLRKKARIPVREGAVVMGGLDETGLVPEGCVFIQVEKRDGSKQYGIFEPIVGPVMVTKHPAMHPGDVRMLLGVDIQELRGHRNVILFSRHGARPEAHKMAGSDLDGDEYAITWDNRLFLNKWNKAVRHENGTYDLKCGMSIDISDTNQVIQSLQEATYPPMAYDEEITVADSPQALSSNEEEHSEELINHLLNCIKNDNLGRICTMWLDYAARSSAMSEECMQLSKLASIAVDFPKRGVPAVIPEELMIRKSEPRPHWRECKGSPSYICNCIIGNLYDDLNLLVGDIAARKAPAEVGRKRDRYGQVTCRVGSQTGGDPLTDVYEESIPANLGFFELTRSEQDQMQLLANEQRLAFEDRVLEVMNKFSIRSEGELFTGCIRKFNKRNKKKQHAVAEEVRRQMASIREEFRRLFYAFVLDFSDKMCRGDTGAEIYSRRPTGSEFENISEDADSVTSEPSVIDSKEYTEDEIDCAIKVSISEDIDHDGGRTRESVIKRVSHQLAAAYYMSTYAPKLRWERDSTNLLLFMFPWIVVADLLPTSPI